MSHLTQPLGQDETTWKAVLGLFQNAKFANGEIKQVIDLKNKRSDEDSSWNCTFYLDLWTEIVTENGLANFPKFLHFVKESKEVHLLWLLPCFTLIRQYIPRVTSLQKYCMIFWKFKNIYDFAHAFDILPEILKYFKDSLRFCKLSKFGD